jgi:hypothetical protein
MASAAGLKESKYVSQLYRQVLLIEGRRKHGDWQTARSCPELDALLSGGAFPFELNIYHR